MSGAVDLQHDRWALWLPIAVIFGAAAWMSARTAPPWWLASVLLVSMTACALALSTWRVSGRGRVRMLAAGLAAGAAAFALGASAVDLRVRAVASPKVTQDIGPVRLTGWVLDAEPGATRPRMKVLVDRIDGVTDAPRYARVSVNAALAPGRAIDCLVLLRAPEGPMAPRAFDFARRAYFQQIGATGIALGRCRPTAAPPPPRLLDRLALQSTALRRDITESIMTVAPTQGGALAAAMVTGDRSFMSDATNVAFRDSGLGHLISVSGLHMALVAGGLYTAMHFLLALIGPLALRFPIRKWAAATALVGVSAYLVVSGASVPAQRAYVMTAIALGAVLFDRPAFSLRALGLAAVVVVLMAPESVVDPGFQMSFAATAALIAAFDRNGEHSTLPPVPGRLLGAIDASWKSLSAMLVASLVAGLATDIFAIYHFQRVAVYGLASNVATTPLISFVIAPAAVIAAVLAPFGLADIPIGIMAGALDMVAAIGRVFADRPEAVKPLPLAPSSAFLLAIGALLWACLWRGPVRWLGAVALPLAALLYIGSPRAILIADGDLRAVVARTDSGWIAAADPRRGGFAKERMGGLAGLSLAQAAALPPPDACDDAGCAWKTPRGRDVLRVKTAAMLERPCPRRAIVLSDAPLTPDFIARCAPALALDPADLERNGGVTIAETRTGLLLRRARDEAGARAWSGRLRRSDE